MKLKPEWQLRGIPLSLPTWSAKKPPLPFPASTTILSPASGKWYVSLWFTRCLISSRSEAAYSDRKLTSLTWCPFLLLSRQDWRMWFCSERGSPERGSIIGFSKQTPGVLTAVHKSFTRANHQTDDIIGAWWHQALAFLFLWFADETECRMRN